MACQGIFDGPENQRKRSAQFVAHVAEEGCLRVIEIGQNFSALPFRLVGFGTRDAGRDLAGNQSRNPA